MFDGINASGQVDNFYLGRVSNKVTYLTNTQAHAAVTLKGATSFSSYNTWYHIGCSWNSSTDTATVYLNGEPDGTGTDKNGVDTNQYGVQSSISGPDPVYITGQPLFGNIDDIGVWNKVLSDANFASLYNEWKWSKMQYGRSW